MNTRQRNLFSTKIIISRLHVGIHARMHVRGFRESALSQTQALHFHPVSNQICSTVVIHDEDKRLTISQQWSGFAVSETETPVSATTSVCNNLARASI